MTSRIATSALLLCWAAAPAAGQARATIDQRVQDLRYQIGVVERVLEQAVEHSAARMRNRLQTAVPQADMTLAADARVRGFRQEGYGVFFDVEVPDFFFDTSLPWSFGVLDQSGLGLDSALRELRSFVAKTGDTNAEQALKRIELQMAPGTVTGLAVPSLVPVAGAAAAPARTVTGSAAATALDTKPDTASDPLFNNPAEAYRAEIREALIDAMLQHSRGLNIAPTEWLHVAAKRNDDRPRLTAVNTDDATLHIRVRGADLLAFLGGQITREEAVQRMEVKLH
jgi:hypothetical protein